MKFRDIDEILKHWTDCCDCCDEGSLEYCGHPDCSAFSARGVRSEIYDLLKEETVQQ